MSYKIRFIKTVIKAGIDYTPKALVLWLVNHKLKGIAKLFDFDFDLETRRIYVHVQLEGEAEAIEVWVEYFALLHDEQGYKLLIGEATANRVWLKHLLANIVGKAWKIPEHPLLNNYLPLTFEIFKP